MEQGGKIKQVAKSLLLPAVLLVVLLIFMSSTKPDSVSLPLLMLPFFLIAAILTLLLIPLFRRFSHNHRPVLQAFVVALTPTLLLLLRSINQLSISDVFFVGLFMLGVFWYVRKLSNKET